MIVPFGSQGWSGVQVSGQDLPFSPPPSTRKFTPHSFSVSKSKNGKGRMGKNRRTARLTSD